MVRRLRQRLGPQGVVGDQAEAAPYLREWRGAFTGEAAAVVRPADTAQVAEVVALCAEAGIPVVPQGGNTGLCAGAVPIAESPPVLLSLSRISRVRAVDPANFAITVEAGCPVAAVQAAAAEHDRLFPLSFGAEGTAQIGGALSTNAGGVAVLRYGTARDLALGLEVVLPDGRVWDGLTGLRKDTAGYDLKHLFIGAEGTLGVITAATLKLFPRPRGREVALVGLPSLEAVLAFFVRMRSAVGEYLTAFEMIPRVGIDLALANVAGAEDPLDSPQPWYVLFELSLDRVGEAGTVGEAPLAAAMEAGEVVDGVVAQAERQAEGLWFLREAIVEGERLEGGSAKHDVSLAISDIPAFVARATAVVEEALPGARVVAFGHVGDGNVHFNIVRPEGMERDAFAERAPDLSDLVYREVARVRGSISAEHGIGLLKRDALRRSAVPLELELMARIKRALDPRGLMNPGKILAVADPTLPEA